MKKIALLATILCCLYAGAFAQVRKLRQNEIDYLNKLHAVLYAAIPHTYKGWKENGDKGEFNALKFFCPDPNPPGDCLGFCPVSLGKGDPYSLAVFENFTMPDDQSTPLKVTAFGAIKDYNNAGQIASALKGASKSKLSIKVFGNISANTAIFLLSYCAKKPVTNLTLPVPATLAVMGSHTEGCPIMNSGRADMSPGDGYYDNAIVFIGKPVTAKTPDPADDGQTRIRYAIGFDKTKISVPVTQNIVVQIMGDAEDIKAAIAAIDWKILSGLIGQ